MPRRKRESSQREASAKGTLPIWAQRQGETFAEYLGRYHEEIETTKARACGEELARMDRELGPRRTW